MPGKGKGNKRRVITIRMESGMSSMTDGANSWEAQKLTNTWIYRREREKSDKYDQKGRELGK